MEVNSDKSEELLEDDGGDHDINSEQVFEIGNEDMETESLFGMEGDDMENDSELVLDIETDDHENDSELVLDIETDDHENDSEQILEFENNDLDDKDQMLEFGSKGHVPTGTQVVEVETNNQDKHNPPVVGMEFDSYEDAYKYYNLYAIALGFAIRVKSSWTKRNSKEKRGARLYVPDIGSNNVDVTNPVQRFEHLHKRALQVVEEGMNSLEHYTVAWQAFKESLNKVRLVADKHA
ncbi:hypothetical protein L1987_87798 [Smallanthus sonchifolius]|nr:hypothetical protein L1987_87798 [Smallanthus sonchifolius]